MTAIVRCLPGVAHTCAWVVEPADGGFFRLRSREVQAWASFHLLDAAAEATPAKRPAAEAQRPEQSHRVLTLSGALVVSYNFQRGFDPHILQATNTGIFGMFYSMLIRANPKTYELEPDLASKWESPSQTELVFTLAPNVKWHDKPPVNARALKA